MRTLEFIIEKQSMRLDPDCDLTGLVPGTEGYLQAEFTFSPEWDDCVKVAAFFSNLGREFPAQVIGRNGICNIPAEALEKSIFKVQVIGRGDGKTLTTNKVKVYQRGGNV
jgi:hypothetical protein